MNLTYRLTCQGMSKRLKRLLEAHAYCINSRTYPFEDGKQITVDFKRRLRAYRRAMRKLIREAHKI